MKLSVDSINSVLLVIAAIPAWLFSFELLILAYAFLGPLHYLTEISWLHDRRYFTLRRYDPHILTLVSLVVLFLGVAIVPGSAELVWILLLLAFCTAFVNVWWKRGLILGLGILCLLPFLGSTTNYALAILIPTVCHVFIFTALFMLFGAMKSHSYLGYVNVIIFFLLSILLLFSPSASVHLPAYMTANYTFFDGIGTAIAAIFGSDPTSTILHIATFLAFTYTYHYLNWFSKTSIIEWHKISRYRAIAIGVLYLSAVVLYVIDYQLGFLVLLSLSFLHVVLEFPLNFKSIQGIYRALH
ncbi:MAG: hypothetical protein ACK4SL_03815 [Candidatus Paceibacteria bacterium]